MEANSKTVKMDKVKVGDVMAFTYWGQITGKAFNSVSVKGLDESTPTEFHVNGVPLVEAAASADQFHETVKANKTEIAEKLVASHRKPFTVCFEKENGEERVLRGRLIAHEIMFGRSQVEDLDQPEKDRFRLVDHRSLKWLIVDGIKFEAGRKK